MDTFMIVALLSLVVTKVVDTIRNGVDLRDKFPKVVWNLSAFSIGVLMSIVFDVNVLEQLGTAVNQQLLGQVITGILLGAGGSGWHEILDMFSSRGHQGNPKVPDIND